MTFGLWPMLAWATEFVLELGGVWFAYRRRLTFLAAYLAFSAFADLATFLILLRFGGNAYGFAAWVAEAIGYVLLCLLACQLAARMLRERKPIWTYAAFLSVIGATVVTIAFRQESGWMGKFLSAEIAASCYIVVALLVAWVAKEGHLEAPWNLILAGIVTLVGGNALCAWFRAWQLYPLGEILGLGMLAWAGWKDYRLEEFRRSLPPKIGPQSESTLRLSSRMVN